MVAYAFADDRREEGFGDVIDGAEVQSAFFVSGTVERRNENGRNFARVVVVLEDLDDW